MLGQCAGPAIAGTGNDMQDGLPQEKTAVPALN